jgi:type IV pilus assembly protein PilC
MMTLKQTADSASALGNQLRARIPVAEAASILSTLQPEFAEFWNRATLSIEAGNPLSQSLREVWPESLVSAVVAGEEAGKNEEAFKRIEVAVGLQLALRSTLMKLVYPLVICFVGIVLFVLMMVLVVPMTTNAFGTVKAADMNVFTAMSILMEGFFKTYWTIVLSAVAAGGILFARWMQTEEGKAAVLNQFLDLPVVGHGLKELYFGLWAEYMAMMCTAGIPTIQGLMLTIKVLPGKLQAGISAFERDLSVNNLPMEQAANPKRHGAGDPRAEWPLYIGRAFIVGERTGEIDVELLRVSPLLVENGTKMINRSVHIANIVAMVFAGSLIAMSFAAIYLPMFSALKNAH